MSCLYATQLLLFFTFRNSNLLSFLSLANIGVRYAGKAKLHTCARVVNTNKGERNAIISLLKILIILESIFSTNALEIFQHLEEKLINNTNFKSLNRKP
jgi:hypothetical protein